MAALWDAVDLYRGFALLYAVYEFSMRLDEVARPFWGWSILAILAVWTVAMLVHRTRTMGQLWIELGLSTGAIIATRWIDDPVVREAGSSTVPGIWAGAIVLAAGVHRGPGGAFAAWAAVVLADLIEIGSPTSGTVHNIFLLFVMAGCAGYSSQAARRGDDAVREGARLRAQTAERERLARTVHDGVLQALAYIHRRGEDLGGEVRELGDLAAAQERRLRDLIATPSRDLSDPDIDGPSAGRGRGWPGFEPGDSAGRDGGAGAGSGPRTDLAAILRDRVGQDAHIAAPADPVVLPSERAGEVAAAVQAAVDNSRRHAGRAVGIWILLEQEGADVVVTVRDDGVGIPDGGLQAARARGRLGVAVSIVSRLEDLGGRATCHTAPGEGTTWEMRVPRLASSGRDLGAARDRATRNRAASGRAEENR
ncbi:MAG: DUF5931 domain-containing protein [Micrococcales bacterium]|nr:DUF5931 domain-containing protein [Micrococcales bacterium]